MESQATSSRQVVEDGYSEYGATQASQRKMRKKSKVWKELLQGMNAQGEKIATCKHCKVTLVAKPGSGTSHFKRHLDRCLARPSGYQCGDGDSDDGREFVFNMNKLRKEIVLNII